jgi:hypothetical protein
VSGVEISPAKPTLHEIAAMSFPASMRAMREHYNPHWHKPEADGEPLKFRVTVNYSYKEWTSATYDVEATDEDDAERVAMEMFDEDRSLEGDDQDVDYVEVEEVSQ